MRKYKLLRYGHCYINKRGDFAIGLVSGNKSRGYTFIASYAHPNVLLGKIYVQSRIVLNDGYWSEISPEMYGIAANLHSSGYNVKFPLINGKELPVISKF